MHLHLLYRQKLLSHFTEERVIDASFFHHIKDIVFNKLRLMMQFPSMSIYIYFFFNDNLISDIIVMGNCSVVTMIFQNII